MHTTVKFLFPCQPLFSSGGYFPYICQRRDEIQALFIADHIDILVRKDQAIPRIGIEIESISILLKSKFKY